MISIINEVEISEYNNKDVDYGSNILSIKSHWNSDRMIVLVFDKISITVSASDLQAAITNATNTNCYGR